MKTISSFCMLGGFYKFLKFFKIQFAISIMVKSLHYSFNLQSNISTILSQNQKLVHVKFDMKVFSKAGGGKLIKEMLTPQLFNFVFVLNVNTCLGLIVLCILANSSRVMKPSWSLSRAYEQKVVTQNPNFNSTTSKLYQATILDLSHNKF